MRSKGFSLLFTLLLLPTFTSATLADQNLHVSKGIEGFNFSARFAINPTNGDVYAVWDQNINNASNSRVWGRLIKRKANGSYAMKKATMLSSASGWNLNANVAYIPWKDEFLVVWDKFGFDTGLVPGPIQARVVNKKGKAKKPAFNIVSDKRANGWAFACPVPGANAAGPAASGTVYMVYSAYPTSTADKQAGLRVVQLDSKYKATNHTKLIIKSSLMFNTSINEPPGSKPADDHFFWEPLVLANDVSAPIFRDGGFNVQVNWLTSSTLDVNDINDAGIFWFFDEKNLGFVLQELKGIPVDTNVFWAFSACTNNVDFTLTVTNGDVSEDGKIKIYQTPIDGAPKDTRLVGSFNNPTESFSFLDVETIPIATCSGSPEDAPNPAANTKFMQLVYDNDKGVFSRDISVNGKGKVKIGKKVSKVFSHKSNLMWMEADTYLNTNTRVIIWVKRSADIKEDDTEIWLNIK